MWNCTVTSYLEENRPAHADSQTSQCEQVIYVTEVNSTLLIFMWKIMHGICMLVLRLWGFCHLSGGLTSLPVLSGAEDTVSPEEDGPVFGHLGLCQTCLPEGGCGCFLQGLHPQHAGHHTLRWHRLGCLWGVCGCCRCRGMTSLFVIVFLSFWLWLSSPLSDAEEFLAAALRHRQRWSGSVCTPGLWHYLQHMWPAVQLPTRPGQDSNAGTRSVTAELYCTVWLLPVRRIQRYDCQLLRQVVSQFIKMLDLMQQHFCILIIPILSLS